MLHKPGEEVKVDQQYQGQAKSQAQKREQATFGKFYLVDQWKQRLHDALSGNEAQNQSTIDKMWLWNYYEFEKQLSYEGKLEKGNLLAPGMFTNRISMNFDSIKQLQEQESKKNEELETG